MLPWNADPLSFHLYVAYRGHLINDALFDSDGLIQTRSCQWWDPKNFNALIRPFCGGEIIYYSSPGLSEAINQTHPWSLDFLSLRNFIFEKKFHHPCWTTAACFASSPSSTLTNPFNYATCANSWSFAYCRLMRHRGPIIIAPNINGRSMIDKPPNKT